MSTCSRFEYLLLVGWPIGNPLTKLIHGPESDGGCIEAILGFLELVPARALVGVFNFDSKTCRKVGRSVRVVGFEHVQSLNCRYITGLHAMSIFVNEERQSSAGYGQNLQQKISSHLLFFSQISRVEMKSIAY